MRNSRCLTSRTIRFRSDFEHCDIFLRGLNSGQLEQLRGGALGDPAAEDGGDLLFPFLLDRVQEALVERFLRVRGAQVEFEGDRTLPYLSARTMARADVEHGRAGDAVMRPERFAEILRDLAALVRGPDGDVLDRRALEVPRPGLDRLEGDDGGIRLDQGVAGLPGERVAVAGGSGGGIAQPAGGD